MFTSTKSRSSGFQVSEISFRYQGGEVDMSSGTSTYAGNGNEGGGSPGPAFDQVTASKAGVY